MDPKAIQQRIRRTAQAQRFAWENPSAPLRRSLRELAELAERLQPELDQAKQMQKYALSWAKLVPAWKVRLAALMKQLVAGMPAVAKGGAPRTPDGLVARIRREFPRYDRMPAAMKKPFIRLQQVPTSVATTQRHAATYQRASAAAERQLARTAARWDAAWKALRAEAKRQHPADKRVAKLFA